VELFFYQLRLTLRSIRRNPGLSFAIVLSLALSTAIWTTAVVHNMLLYGPPQKLSPALHQVELPHSSALDRYFRDGAPDPAAWATRSRVTFPEYEILAASGIPVRQSGTFRSRVMIAAGDAGAPSVARIERARFVNADFFPLFSIPVGRGRPFSADEEKNREPVVVLGYRLDQELFGDRDSVGRTLVIEGRPFRVIGVTTQHQIDRPAWDISLMGGRQDAVYVPFGWFRSLLARPEVAVQQSPIGPHFDDLFRSDAVFVSFWAELATDDQRVAYARYLDEHFARRGIRHTLRSYKEWLAAFKVPPSPVSFFALLTAIVLLAGGFNMTRLLLAKAFARRQEHAVHRALGATSRSLFARQMLEVAVLSLPAAALGALLGVFYNEMFNKLASDSDIPLRLSGLAFVLSAGPAFVVGVASGLYPAWQTSRTPTGPNLGRS
jgi:putative ABC transport system permease protein